MVRRITDIDWIVVGSELEALILEMNLIKKYRPHFNVRLKDDKRYPYIKVHWAKPFPKLTVTRQMVNDGSRYFGPYTSVWAVHQTLDVIRGMGARHVVLEVRPSNTGARSLYEKFGFTLLGFRRGYYQNPMEDALVLIKYFQDPIF